MKEQNFSLTDLEMAAAFISNLLNSGIPLDQALVEMSKLQKQHEQFWLDASVHCRTGNSLSSYLKEFWPNTVTGPVEIGEMTGQLPEIFRQIEETISLQLEIRKKLGKLKTPAGMIVAGIGVCVFFLIGVIPSLIKGLPKSDTGKSLIVQLSDTIQNVLHNHQLLLIGTIMAVAGGIYMLFKQPETRQAMLAKLDYVPGLGLAIRSLYYGLWARYMSLMTRCGISPIDAIQRSNNLLLPYMVPSVMAIAENAGRGLAEAVDQGRMEEDDPRQQLPVFIVNAFRLTDSTGDSDKHFQAASQPLVNIGMKVIERFIEVSNGAAIAIAAIFALTPMLMYFLQLADVVKIVGK